MNDDSKGGAKALPVPIKFDAAALAAIDELRGDLSREKYVAELYGHAPTVSANDVRFHATKRQERIEKARLHAEAVKEVGRAGRATVARELYKKYGPGGSYIAGHEGEWLTTTLKDGRRHHFKGGTWAILLKRIREADADAPTNDAGFTVSFGGA